MVPLSKSSARKIDAAPLSSSIHKDIVFRSVLDPHLDKGPPTRIIGRKRSDRLPFVKAVAKRRKTAKQIDDSTDHSDRRGPPPSAIPIDLRAVSHGVRIRKQRT
jgi:hypothetical protein